MIPEIEEFGQFADNCFTRYAGNLYNAFHSGYPVNRKDVAMAYSDCSELLDAELEQKIEDLCGTENGPVRQRLVLIKKRYTENLLFHAGVNSIFTLNKLQ